MNDGVLLLNKHSGPSSARVLNPIKRAYSGAKVGHTGTLDPFASGLLVILVGRATRLSRWFLKLDKTYTAVVRFGIETDTLDLTGSVVRRAAVPQRDQIENSLPRLVGSISQVPPAYSAIKIGGRRAYELARNGQEVTPQPRVIEVYEAHVGRCLAQTDDYTDYELRVSCGSGTYIRSIARDLGTLAGSCASLAALERTSVGPFSLDETNPDGQIDLLPTLAAVERLGFATIARTDDEEIVRKLRNGARFSVEALRSIAPTTGQTYAFAADDEIVAIATRRGSELVYETVFPAIRQ